QQADPLVVLVDFHDDHAIHQPLPDQLVQIVQVVHVIRPQHEVVLVLFGGHRRACDEFELGVAQPALRGRKEQGDQAAALARQAARQGMRLVAKLVNRREDALPRRLGNRARPVQGIRHRAHGNARAAGNVGHGGHRKLSAHQVFTAKFDTAKSVYRNASTMRFDNRATNCAVVSSQRFLNYFARALCARSAALYYTGAREDTMPTDLFADIPPSPDASLWVGGAGCGKTQAVIDEILERRRFGSGFRPIWVLLASSAQVVSFRQRLLDTSRDGVLFGVEFFTFADLYLRVLDRANDPQHLIHATARTHVLRRVIEQLNAEGRLELFGPIAGTPGFVSWVGRLVSDLKQELAPPEKYLDVAASRGAKDRDLALIYDAYQRFLRDRNLVDSHGAGWLALEHVQNGSARTDDVQMLVADGFDQFNRLHVELLTALAQRIGRTIVTL